jgi:hypothetical protein
VWGSNPNINNGYPYLLWTQASPTLVPVTVFMPSVGVSPVVTVSAKQTVPFETVQYWNGQVNSNFAQLTGQVVETDFTKLLSNISTLAQSSIAGAIEAAAEAGEELAEPLLGAQATFLGLTGTAADVYVDWRTGNTFGVYADLTKLGLTELAPLAASAIDSGFGADAAAPVVTAWALDSSGAPALEVLATAGAVSDALVAADFVISFNVGLAIFPYVDQTFHLSDGLLWADSKFFGGRLFQYQLGATEN